MPVRKEITDKEGVYFITFTCTNWLPLFSICNSYDVVYKWFDYLKANGHYIIGYVIMPNHLHALIAFKNTGKSINTMVANGKRFMAYDLVKRLEEKKKILVLKELQKELNNTERKQGKKYGVFEPFLLRNVSFNGFLCDRQGTLRYGIFNLRRKRFFKIKHL